MTHVGRTFSFSLYGHNKRILRIHGAGGTTTTPELVQRDLSELYGFVQRTFADRPFRLLTVLERMHLTLDRDAELATQGSLAMAQTFNVERAAYAVDKATLRLQFSRLFRENRLADRFRAFISEPEALTFLTLP